MTLVAIALGVASVALGLLRWLRVAQRQHYIPGAGWVTASRWIRCRPPNAWLALAAFGAASATLTSQVLGNQPGTVAGAVVTFFLAGLFPRGMALVGSPRLRLTRRATILTGLSAALALLAWTVLTLATDAVAALTIVAIGTPVVVDGAASISAPFERRALERHRRRAHDRLVRCDPFVVAVTGSWGKTSTKNHIRDLLAESVNVVASPASWNNTAGLSRTVNEHLTEATEVLVVEMGMYKPGEIRQMCSWVRPHVAVICAIGPMHLERVGSIEGIAGAKAEILERADTAVLWVDDPRIANLADRCEGAKVWRVGTRGSDAALDIEVEVDHGRGEIVVWAQGSRLGACPTSGGLHAGNVGCAVAAALAYGTAARQVGSRLATLSNPDHRARTATNDAGVVVIDDTFNANPSGARSAIGALKRSVDGRRAVVTPGMVELGAQQEAENTKLAQAVVDSDATLVVVGWTNRRALIRGAAAGSRIVLPNRGAAVTWVREHLSEGDGVLWENDLPDHYP